MYLGKKLEWMNLDEILENMKLIFPPFCSWQGGAWDAAEVIAYNADNVIMVARFFLTQSTKMRENIPNWH
jgi:hypothetical protein